MSTSGTIDFTITANEIITDALAEIGVYGDGETVTDDDITLCMRRLNMMVKSWNNRPHMHLREDETITLTPGTESYTWGAGGDIDTDRPVRVVTARRLNTDGNEVPIDVDARSMYKELPTKSSTGATNLINYDPQLDLGVLYVWPTGDSSNNKIICEVQRQVEDFDAVTDNPDFPKEAYVALYLGLAVNVYRPYYAMQDPPPGLERQAKEAYNDWLKHDEDINSFFIQPKKRGR